MKERKERREERGEGGRKTELSWDWESPLFTKSNSVQ